MPSAALLRWKNDRVARLHEFAAQHATALASVPPKVNLADENLRGYVILLSAHFQGYCRDLYTEASDVMMGLAPNALQLAIKTQCAAHVKLKQNNPTFDNIAEDFGRFGFDLKTVLKALLGHAMPVNNLALLNKWRNYAAHHAVNTPPGPSLTMPIAQTWLVSCDWLAMQFDAILYNWLNSMFGIPPW